ncbi:hypothetical protein MFUL124B02_21665 [Myxococcus fulvus 124B02]|nr:hypothetical protein MFUL124B02_21665 [Myxococcus fulvus 124B02]
MGATGASLWAAWDWDGESTIQAHRGATRAVRTVDMSGKSRLGPREGGRCVLGPDERNGESGGVGCWTMPAWRSKGEFQMS